MIGNFMRADDAFRQKFRKDVSHGFNARIVLTERGLVLGGALLANGRRRPLHRWRGRAHPYSPRHRLWTRCWARFAGRQNIGAAATNVSPPFISRKAASASPDEEGAYRLSLAVELIDAGIAPRELARELGLGLPADLLSNTIRTSRACRPEAAAKAAKGRSMELEREPIPSIT
jgi:hypothetical protein